MEDRSMRADAALAARGLASSREKARGLIEAGLVTVNGAIIKKPAQKVGGEDVLRVLGETHPYVSRGGLKLEKALTTFEVDPSGQVCMDIGASTGGFTDVLLRNGARKVYAIDVGTGQLAPKLLGDPKVVSMERVNARTLETGMFPERPTLAVMDVSFISIRLVLPAVKSLLKSEAELVCLIKPQFEAGREEVGKKGVVRDSRVHEQVIEEILRFAPTAGLSVMGLDYSPIKGPEGNIEYLCYMKNGFYPSPAFDVAALVQASHETL